MRRWLIPGRLATGVAAIACISVAKGQVPEGYEVVRLTAPGDLAIHSRPDINNRGDVVWSASFPPDQSHIRLFSRGRILELTDDTTYAVNPAMNNVGGLAWMEATSSAGPYGIVVRCTDSAVAIPGVLDANETPAINDAGTVVWGDDFSGDATHVELFCYDAQGSIEQLTTNGLSNQQPRLNDLGAIVWAALNFDSSPFTGDIRYLSGTQELELTPGDAEGGAPDVNNNGEVVWAIRSGGVGYWNGLEPTVLVIDGGTPKINNVGHVGFVRQDSGDGRKHVWLYRNADLLLLPDFGYSAAGLNLNERDELVWRGVDLNTGDTAIFEMRRVAADGDFDHDCDIDLSDFGVFQECFAREASGEQLNLLGLCSRADFDQDGDVDLLDFNEFQLSFTGGDRSIEECIP